MKIFGQNRASILFLKDAIEIMDQRLLPHEFKALHLDTWQACAEAITSMAVRGAPLLSFVGGFGLAFAYKDEAPILEAYQALRNTRPTAVNLSFILDEIYQACQILAPSERYEKAWQMAENFAKEDADLCHQIGLHGLSIIQKIYAQKKQAVRVMTHCNAGWLATMNYGTALAPLYLAQEAGLPLMVYASETRPRFQGALSAFELQEQGLDVRVIVDNAAGLLLQKNEVDLLIVGADRVSPQGHVFNKIGTYLKALAAKAHGVPFYVALPYSTIDWGLNDPLQVEIEERSADEISHIQGQEIYPNGTRFLNPGFDMTPPELITGFITEKGICTPSELKKLYDK